MYIQMMLLTHFFIGRIRRIFHDGVLRFQRLLRVELLRRDHQIIIHSDKRYVRIESQIYRNLLGRLKGITVKRFNTEYPDEYPDLEANIRREAGNQLMALAGGVSCVRCLGHDGSGIMFEFMDARSLQDVLLHSDSGPDRKEKSIIHAFKVLHDLHQLGICHGDAHPSNFLIDRRGKAYACDFGLSHSASYPFTAPPPTRCDQEYFSNEQNRALEADHTGSRHPGGFQSNNVPPRADIIMFARHLLKLGGLPDNCVRVLTDAAAGRHERCDRVIALLEGKPTPEPLPGRSTGGETPYPLTSRPAITFGRTLPAEGIKPETAPSVWNRPRRIAVTGAAALTVLTCACLFAEEYRPVVTSCLKYPAHLISSIGRPRAAVSAVSRKVVTSSIPPVDTAPQAVSTTPATANAQQRIAGNASAVDWDTLPPPSKMIESRPAVKKRQRDIDLEELECAVSIVSNAVWK